MIIPIIDTLPAAQPEIWPALQPLSDKFVLYGGTGLALRLGHRPSPDFDFFSHYPLDHDRLFALPLLLEADTRQKSHVARDLALPESLNTVKNLGHVILAQTQVLSDFRVANGQNLFSEAHLFGLLNTHHVTEWRTNHSTGFDAYRALSLRTSPQTNAGSSASL